MQQSVLDRIRAEETDAQLGSARPRPFRWILPKPLVWATVAAAAFLIVVRVGPGMFRVGSSKPMAPQVASSAPADRKTASPTAMPAAPGKAEERAANPPAQAPATKAAAQEPTGKTAPESRQGANATAAGDDAGVASHSNGDATVTGAPVTTLAAVPTPQRVMVAGTDLAVELTPGLVRGFSAGQGEIRWERPLEGVTAQSRVVTSPDGSLIAILTQSEQSVRLWVLDSQGRPLYTETLRAVPNEISFEGGNLRIVVNGEVQVRVIPQGP